MEIKRGQIYQIETPASTVGSEQARTRPGVIVSNDKCNEHSNIIQVVFVTSADKRWMPTHVKLEGNDVYGTILCEQITLISTERIGMYRGTLDALTLAKVDDALRVQLGLASDTHNSPDAGSDVWHDKYNQLLSKHTDLEKSMIKQSDFVKLEQENQRISALLKSYTHVLQDLMGREASV